MGAVECLAAFAPLALVEDVAISPKLLHRFHITVGTDWRILITAQGLRSQSGHLNQWQFSNPHLQQIAVREGTWQQSARHPPICLTAQEQGQFCHLKSLRSQEWLCRQIFN